MDLQNAMLTQATSFFNDVLANKGGTLTALLTSQTVFMNNKTALLYGAPATSMPADGSFQSSQRTDGTASGLLSLPAFLATQSKASESSPIYRGKFVREQLLCQELPSPPANVPPAPDVKPGASTRDRLSQHETDATCAACHVMMDPIGFAFENYDGIGRYRTTDGGKPIDTSGTLAMTDVNGPLTGVAQLGGEAGREPDRRGLRGKAVVPLRHGPRRAGRRCLLAAGRVEDVPRRGRRPTHAAGGPRPDSGVPLPPPHRGEAMNRPAHRQPHQVHAPAPAGRARRAHGGADGAHLEAGDDLRRRCASRPSASSACSRRTGPSRRPFSRPERRPMRR